MSFSNDCLSYKNTVGYKSNAFKCDKLTLLYIKQVQLLNVLIWYQRDRALS